MPQTCPAYTSYQAQTTPSWSTNQQQQQHHHHPDYVSPTSSSYEAPKQLLSSHSPVADAPTAFAAYDDYQQIMHPTTNNATSPEQSSSEHQHHHRHQNASRILDERLGYSNNSLTSPEPFYYQNNATADRCHYTCELLDTRLNNNNNNAAGNNHHAGSNNNMGYAEVPTDIDLPPFVDYTLVGMLCSSAEEEQQQNHNNNNNSNNNNNPGLLAPCQQQAIVHGYGHHHH